MRSVLCRVVLLAVAIFVSGCGGDDPLRRDRVTGTVSFDGQP
ncbi:MAG: hypothetical protein JWN70_348, partial [Planctomycetaceae bacterium]|nr:hypothetical protein [Planctomycetaceae bacterium]